MTKNTDDMRILRRILAAVDDNVLCPREANKLIWDVLDRMTREKIQNDEIDVDTK